VTVPKARRPGDQQRGAGRARPGPGQEPTRRPLAADRTLWLAPGSHTLYTTHASGTRRSLERYSARLLLYLHQLPRWLPPLVLAALLVAGLTLTGWAGAAPLAAVALVLGWLAALSWPALDSKGRLLRLAGVACLLALAVVQAVR